MAITVEQLERKVRILEQAVRLLEEKIFEARADAKAAEKIALTALDKSSVVQVASTYAPPSPEPWEAQPKPIPAKPIYRPVEEPEEEEDEEETVRQFSALDTSLDDDGYDPALDKPVLSSFKNPKPRQKTPEPEVRKVVIGGENGLDGSEEAQAAFREELWDEALGE